MTAADIFYSSFRESPLSLQTSISLPWMAMVGSISKIRGEWIMFWPSSLCQCRHLGRS